MSHDQADFCFLDEYLHGYLSFKRVHVGPVRRLEQVDLRASATNSERCSTALGHSADDLPVVVHLVGLRLTVRPSKFFVMGVFRRLFRGRTWNSTARHLPGEKCFSSSLFKQTILFFSSTS